MTENLTKMCIRDSPKADPQMRLPWIAITGTPEMTITGMGLYQQNFDKPNFALYFAEVEVNLETGEAKLLRALEGTDVGQIIDPVNVRMQAEGSFGAAGADTALFEEMVMDKKLGRFVSGNMIDYKWRTFKMCIRDSSHTGDKITAGGKQVFPGGCCLCTSINCDGSDSRNHAFTFWGEWGDFSSPTEELSLIHI